MSLVQRSCDTLIVSGVISGGSADSPASLQAMAQEEADAVAALMAAASGDVRSEAEQAPEEEGSPPGAP